MAVESAAATLAMMPMCPCRLREESSTRRASRSIAPDRESPRLTIRTKRDDDDRRMAEPREDLVLGHESQNGGDNQGPRTRPRRTETSPRSGGRRLRSRDRTAPSGRKSCRHSNRRPKESPIEAPRLRYHSITPGLRYHSITDGQGSLGATTQQGSTRLRRDLDDSACRETLGVASKREAVILLPSRPATGGGRRGSPDRRQRRHERRDRTESVEGIRVKRARNGVSALHRHEPPRSETALGKLDRLPLA